MDTEELVTLPSWLDPATLSSRAQEWLESVVAWTRSPAFSAEIMLVVASFVAAFLLGRLLGVFLGSPSAEGSATKPGSKVRFLRRLQPLLLPLLTLLVLNSAAAFSQRAFGDAWLVRIVEGGVLVWLMLTANREYATSGLVRSFVKWVLTPIAIAHIFGFLTPIVTYLDTVRFSSGNISVSLYTLARVLIFGSVLFWLGRQSNNTGKQYIRQQQALDVGTREVFAKLFEIAVFCIIFILLLQIVGINLTALAVFGGALGVGLGFGLQSIASNFISGVIILLDRSLTVGDFIELEDGRAGVIRELTMRSAILKTFEGKDIVVPNETFVTSSFINWTHENKKQRYSIEFQVAYSTDIEPMLDMLKELVASHPQVLSGEGVTEEELPDAEISGFGDSGVNILIEYWMEGIDDGRNRVDADLNLMIFKALKEHGVEIPFPQREVRLVGQGAPGS